VSRRSWRSPTQRVRLARTGGCDYTLETVSPRPGSRPKEFFFGGFNFEPAFSPRDSTIAQGAFDTAGNNFIAVGSLAGRGESDRTVFNVKDGSVGRPRWSRTGRSLLFQRDREDSASLLRIDLRTGRVSQGGPEFTFPSDATVSTLETKLQPDWASTGNIVLDTHPGPAGRLRSELAVMNATGHHLRLVTRAISTPRRAGRQTAKGSHSYALRPLMLGAQRSTPCARMDEDSNGSPTDATRAWRGHRTAPRSLLSANTSD
jgi:Tol biopolymer transport system component